MDVTPTGFVVVDALDASTLNLLHVSITVASLEPLKYEISLSGIWEFSDKEKVEISNLIQGRVPVGTKDGIEFIKKHIGIEDSPGILSRFVLSATKEQELLQELWQAHKDEEPSKRKKLVTPKWPEWPADIDDSAPVDMLESMGRLAFPDGTPKDMRPLIAFGRLMYIMLENWMVVEEQRLQRKFLKEISKHPRKWPPGFEF